MSYGVDRGSDVTYHTPWASATVAPAPRSSPLPLGFSGAGAKARTAAAMGEALGVDDTPLFAAASLLDRSTPVALGAEETPLFDEVPSYEGVRRADEERLVRTFRLLPIRWQEVLWFTQVEGISETETSVHMGLTAQETGIMADEALSGLRRAWVADDLGAGPVSPSCAVALWALCGPEGWRELRHIRTCESCSDVARRLEDVLVRSSQVLLSVALASMDKGSFDQAV